MTPRLQNWSSARSASPIIDNSVGSGFVNPNAVSRPNSRTSAAHSTKLAIDELKETRLKSLLHRATSTDLVPHLYISLSNLIRDFFPDRVKRILEDGGTNNTNETATTSRMRHVIETAQDYCLDLQTTNASRVNPKDIKAGLIIVVNALYEMTNERDNLIKLVAKLQEETTNLRESIEEHYNGQIPLEAWRGTMTEINRACAVIRQDGHAINCPPVEEFRRTISAVQELTQEKVDAIEEISKLLAANNNSYPTETINDLPEVFANVFRLRKSLAEMLTDQSLEMKLHIDSSLKDNSDIQTNRWSLIETIKILIDNAYKHGDFHGASKEVEVSAKLEDSKLIIETKNPGTIPDEILAKLGIEPVTTDLEGNDNARQHQHGEGVYGIAGFINHVNGRLTYTNENGFVKARAEIPVTLSA